MGNPVYRTDAHEARSYSTYTLQSSHDTGDWTGVHIAISTDGQYLAEGSDDHNIYPLNRDGTLL